MRQFLAIALAASMLASIQARAADPRDGVWVYDKKDSYWSDNRLPEDMKMSMNLKFANNKIEYHSINDTDPKNVHHYDFVAPLDGTPAAFENQERYNQVSVKQLSRNELQFLKMKDGDVIVGEFWTFRPDGKSYVRRGVAKGADGTSKAYQEVFTRQETHK